VNDDEQYQAIIDMMRREFDQTRDLIATNHLTLTSHIQVDDTRQALYETKFSIYAQDFARYDQTIRYMRWLISGVGAAFALMFAYMELFK